MSDMVMALMTAPATGDDFQSGKLFVVVGIALALAVATVVVSKIRGGNDEDDEE